jgi:hypothetical protein
MATVSPIAIRIRSVQKGIGESSIHRVTMHLPSPDYYLSLGLKF